MISQVIKHRNHFMNLKSAYKKSSFKPSNLSKLSREGASTVQVWWESDVTLVFCHEVTLCLTTPELLPGACQKQSSNLTSEHIQFLYSSERLTNWPVPGITLNSCYAKNVKWYITDSEAIYHFCVNSYIYHTSAEIKSILIQSSLVIFLKARF